MFIINNNYIHYSFVYGHNFFVFVKGEGVSKTATIRPNETVKFTIELHNEAPFNRFLLTANPLISSLESPTTNISEFMEYSLMPSSTSLSTNSSTSVYLAVAAINVDQSMSVRFTVFAEAEGNREINNYIELNVFATNIPPGNVTKNVSCGMFLFLIYFANFISTVGDRVILVTISILFTLHLVFFE